MRYYIESLGCPKNLVDSEVFAFILERNGYEQNDDYEGSDIVVINTCAFLQSALAEFDEILANIVEGKNLGSIKQVAVTGCVMNRALDDFKSVYPEVDAWIPLKDFDAFDGFLKGNCLGEYHRSNFQNLPYAYLRISDGCNNRCSYCAIPSIRGNLNSVPLESLVAEAQDLASHGAKELVIIAQDTCSYGLDIYGRKALPDLIEELLKIKGFHWLRLMYMHPDNFELDWLELYHRHPRLLPYFEIPVQHFSDPILRAMNRKKNANEIANLFAQIKSALPNAVFRTTIITGFPGEKRNDFESLEKFIEQIPILHMGTFAYSPEPGTPAFSYPKKPLHSTAEKRSARLLNQHQEKAQKMLESYIGTKVEVLIEHVIEDGIIESSNTGSMTYAGRAWFQAPDIDGIVEFEGSAHKLGDIVLVELDDSIGIDFFGHVER